MDSHTLTVLEYGDVLTHLASCAQSEPGRKLALFQLPQTMEPEVRKECELTGEALVLLGELTPDFGKVTDTSSATDRLRIEGAVLEPEQILYLYANQLAARDVKKIVRDREKEIPGLSSLADSLNVFPEWEQRVRRSLSGKGEVLDTASPALAEARKAHRTTREEVVGRLERFIRGKTVSKVIQEPYITTRNGRHVVPAKPEYQRVFEGVVQDSSQSGQTLFVEPLFAVGLNNGLFDAENRVRNEVQKILEDISREARINRDAMAANMRTLAAMDVAFAKARLGVRLKGILPELDPVRSDLREARHPLLEMDTATACIPIGIGIGGKMTSLVITGPNTGGKTVALKTLGLLTLMVQSGIPVPVSPESRIRVFGRIFADIGDEQNLTQNLSTFSGHMKIIAGLLETADEHTLVLLDELGAGTDPQEGSALGIALMEELHERGACAVITTHHNLLKDFAYRAPYAENASMVFDADTLKPTYNIRMGAAGRSHALRIAGSLGLDRRVISRAREIMGAEVVQVDELLGRLGEEIDRKERARQKAEEAAEKLELARTKQMVKHEKYREQVRDIRDKTRREARVILREIEKQGREIIKSIGDIDRESARGVLRDGIVKLEEKVEKAMPAVRPKGRGGPVKSGDVVRILPIGIRGRVEALTLEGSEAEVLSGGIRMRVPVRDLSPISQQNSADAKVPKTGAVTFSGEDEVGSEINLLGQKVQDALDSVGRFLDRSMMTSAHTVRIVHGKGTGALRKAIREALGKDPRVSSFGPAPLNEGGEGVTVVELKE